ncbi:hypothetical protein [Cohnella faecalis]|uniref:Uncharacterized protein n=1 Tax=Cohnella faecalis TaxID=2315694 RepID=A0A398CWW6_9BACL|nr:hypothetical protein [Cohnella faecalis]RIE03504.1 hypothetical protein D3H35_12715 [Cohnella faecalis]
MRWLYWISTADQRQRLSHLLSVRGQRGSPLDAGQAESGRSSRRTADVQLQFYRGSNPMLPPQPYGLLDIRLEARYPFEEALVKLRELHPEPGLNRLY